MLWSFELELRHGFRTKKLWIMVAVMLLLYIPALYFLRYEIKSFTTAGVMTTITRSLSSGILFFLGIVSIVMGSTLINDDIEKGTVTIALSRPITRHGYYLGRYTGQTISVLLALLTASAVFLIALKVIGIPVTKDLAVQAVLLDFLLFLVMTQLLALGHVLSAFIRSHLASVGAAVGVFFLIYLIIPGALATIAQMHSATDHGYNELITKYYTNYAFYSPTAQLSIIMLNTENSMRYLGIVHAVRKRWINFTLLLVMTAVYSGLALWRFKRMDLR